MNIHVQVIMGVCFHIRFSSPISYHVQFMFIAVTLTMSPFGKQNRIFEFTRRKIHPW